MLTVSLASLAYCLALSLLFVALSYYIGVLSYCLQYIKIDLKPLHISMSSLTLKLIISVGVKPFPWQLLCLQRFYEVEENVLIYLNFMEYISPF